MHNIKPMGSFFQIDKEGYIINPCNNLSFDPFWEKNLNKIQTHLQKTFPDILHSIWLRGSVARRQGVPGQSDVDVFALLKAPGYHWQELPDLERLREELGLVTTFPLECQLESYTGVPGELRSQIAMLISTQSAFIWGEDIRPHLKRYKPDKEVMLDYRWIAGDVDAWLSKIEKGETLEIEAFCSFMKTIIRAGFELVMERDGRYTRDLYPCYQIFSQYYPQKESEMRQALHWYLNPIPDRELLKKYLLGFGKWLGENSRNLLPTSVSS